MNAGSPRRHLDAPDRPRAGGTPLSSPPDAFGQHASGVHATAFHGGDRPSSPDAPLQQDLGGHRPAIP